MNRAPQLSAFADSDPTNSILLCDLLDELLSSGNVDDALARLQKVPGTLRELPGVRFREARCALLRGDAARVIQLLQPLQATMADVPAGIVHDLAYAQWLGGKPEEALQTLAQAVYAGDDATTLAILKARILHHQQQCEAALDVLAEHAAGPHLAEVRGMRALLWLDLNNLAQAGIEAEQARAIDPDQHHACLVHGALALASRDTDEATVTFERVVTLHADSGRAWLGLGHAAMLRGDVKDARTSIERASQHMAEHIGTWHSLAWCQLMNDDLPGAERSFECAYALDRTFGETHGGLAVVHAMRGRRKEAEESIKRAMRLDPQGRSGRYAQSLLLFSEGRSEEARQIVKELMGRIPNRVAPLSADDIFSSCVGLAISGGAYG